jgi:hypothetical protein
MVREAPTSACRMRACGSIRNLTGVNIDSDTLCSRNGISSSLSSGFGAFDVRIAVLERKVYFSAHRHSASAQDLATQCVQAKSRT